MDPVAAGFLLLQATEALPEAECERLVREGLPFGPAAARDLRAAAEAAEAGRFEDAEPPRTLDEARAMFGRRGGEARRAALAAERARTLGQIDALMRRVADIDDELAAWPAGAPG